MVGTAITALVLTALTASALGTGSNPVATRPEGVVAERRSAFPVRNPYLGSSVDVGEIWDVDSSGQPTTWLSRSTLHEPSGLLKRIDRADALVNVGIGG